jgi:hypothetical protein
MFPDEWFERPRGAQGEVSAESIGKMAFSALRARQAQSPAFPGSVLI